MVHVFERYTALLVVSLIESGEKVCRFWSVCLLEESHDMRLLFPKVARLLQLHLTLGRGGEKDERKKEKGREREREREREKER